MFETLTNIYNIYITKKNEEREYRMRILKQFNQKHCIYDEPYYMKNSFKNFDYIDFENKYITKKKYDNIDENDKESKKSYKESIDDDYHYINDYDSDSMNDYINIDIKDYDKKTE